MIDQQIAIPTKDGHTATFISHPERGGPFPVILFYMDAPAIREELRDMARRLATSGYYVMLPNLYYRSGVMELGALPADPNAPERKRMFALMGSLTIPMIMDDTRALLNYAEGQAAANTKLIGTVGYCMSGRYAVNAATHFPDRVKAAASVYGTQLATDQDDSPHLAAAKTKSRAVLRLRRDRHLRTCRDHREGEAGHERRQSRGRDLSGHPSRLRLPQASGL
ncbi:carboxymethylenebutenolidase [Bradyrhizobium sp. LB7.2]